MDVERTMEFILNRQAQAKVEMAELRAMAKKSDRRLDAFGKIVTTGMKMLVKFEKESRERDRVTNHKLDLLAGKVDRLIDSLRHSRNGGGR
jgi:hypothetical protein